MFFHGRQARRFQRRLVQSGYRTSGAPALRGRILIPDPTRLSFKRSVTSAGVVRPSDARALMRALGVR